MPITTFPQQGTINTSLLPKRWDIDLYKGDTFDVTVNFKDASNAGIDLTGFTGLVEFKDDTEAVVATPTVTVNYNAVDGAVRILLADTTVLDEGTYKYDLQLTDSGGSKRTFIGGLVNVTGDISD
jgi:hypothetical protein